ncbi:hypothetical protein B296_00038246 [Ensete ventricosum]|uniref:Uncharacterized protein n=1 Tax=Ensete ventricosum TaxID=4639 RepID=A0A426YGS0_ENSVE|nr:hypothetical protein B296_00038246 [Ensete ventricosum]
MLIMLSVLLIVPYCVEMFNLRKIKSGGGASSRSTSTDSSNEKHPSVDEGLSLRKRSRRETPEHQANVSGSTTTVPLGKGKEPVAMEEARE